MRLSHILVILATALAPHAAALDPAARIALSDSRPGVSRAETAYLPLVIELTSPDAPLSPLLDLGSVIMGRRGELVLACVPRDAAAGLERLEIVHRASMGSRAAARLDRAVAATHAAGNVIPGTDDIPYDGEGVIVGICDTGFDPGHAVFADALAAVTYISEYEGRALTVTGDDARHIDSDDPHGYHATHVAGILAGNGAGTPYRGVAPGAELYVATSSLCDMGILAGVEAIIEYAREHDKPAVINLSLGSSLGPADGSDLFCRYLDRCAISTPILLSAGNEGNAHNAVRHTFTADRPSIDMMVSDLVDWDYINLGGYIAAWSDDSRPLDVRLRVYDVDERRYVHDFGPIGESLSLDSNDDPALAAYFSGDIAAAAGIDPGNDRYNLLMRLNLRATTMRQSGPWARHCLVVTVSGQPGTSCRVAADGDRLSFIPVSGLGSLFKETSTDLSISSLACGHNTVAVGSSTTRVTTPLLRGGETTHTDVYADAVSPFSSYGTLADGRSLPHFCAPGAYVVSAASREYVKSRPSMLYELCADSPDFPGHFFMTDCGTSMASPHAAGIFALWLQAMPSLSPSQLRDIALATASTGGVDPDDPRTGAGVIDARAGLEYIHTRLGIGSVDPDPDDSATAAYYDLQGRQLPGRPVDPGIYIRRTGSHATKFIIR